jgi:histidine ammonia-lyase
MGAALSLEALLGLSAAFDPALHAASNQPGNQKVADNLRSLCQGSRLIDSNPGQVQDAYSLRCTPQVLGPVLDTIEFLRGRFTAALNAATDNPLVFPTEEEDEMRAISGGNFHGQGPAMWLDFLGIAMAEVASIAERRVFRLLIPTSGIDGGLMMGQYTAAALVSDNKTLAHPDSVDSIPTCANQEDHVSMGANAARHCLEILENVRYVLAVELMTAAQAVDLREDGPARLGAGTRLVYEQVRQVVAYMEHDRQTADDLKRLADTIQGGEMMMSLKDL